MHAGVSEFVRDEFSTAEWESFANHLHYMSGGFTKETDYAALGYMLDEIEGGNAHCLFYLATSPRFFAEIGEIGGGRDGPGGGSWRG